MLAMVFPGCVDFYRDEFMASLHADFTFYGIAAINRFV